MSLHTPMSKPLAGPINWKEAYGRHIKLGEVILSAAKKEQNKRRDNNSYRLTITCTSLSFITIVMLISNPPKPEEGLSLLFKILLIMVTMAIDIITLAATSFDCIVDQKLTNIITKAYDSLTVARILQNSPSGENGDELAHQGQSVIDLAWQMHDSLDHAAQTPFVNTWTAIMESNEVN